MTDTVRVALIYGSTRAGRLCDRVAGWAAKQIARTGRFAIETIDPADASLDEIRRRLAASDAIIVVTPEYNHGYPAPLKELIDSLNEEWHAKPVAFVSYGGMSGGIRAVEQLRQVFVELHAMTIRDGVTFPNAWQQFETETPKDSARAERSMAVMLDRLHWWAIALRIARTVTPYAVTA